MADAKVRKGTESEGSCVLGQKSFLPRRKKNTTPRLLFMVRAGCILLGFAIFCSVPGSLFYRGFGVMRCFLCVLENRPCARSHAL